MSLPRDIVRFAQHVVSDLLDVRATMTAEALAVALSVSPGMVSQIRSRKKGVGYETVERLAAVVGMTFEEFRAAARAYATEHPSPTYEPDPRYPNREGAIRAHVDLGAVEADARRWADAATVAAESESDLPPRAWFEQIEAERRRELAGARSLGSRAATDDDLEPPRGGGRKR